MGKVMSTECTTRCFRCDKKMRIERDEDGHMCSMISSGLFFQAHGNYGSTVFDPPDAMNEFLELVICGECVTLNKNEIDHVRVDVPKSKYKTSLFEAVMGESFTDKKSFADNESQ